MQPLRTPLCTEQRHIAEGTGVSTYAQAVAEAQRALDPDSTVLISCGELARWQRWAGALWPRSLAAHWGGSNCISASDPFRRAQVAFDLWRQPLSIRLPGRPGIMHWSYPLPLRAAGWRNVYTVHDLIPLLHPDLTSISSDRHGRLLRTILGRADLIVTVSDVSRTEIINSLGCAPHRVVNCGVAVSRADNIDPPPVGLRSGGYLLVLGSVEPRKNIPRIAAAFEKSGVPLPLVIAGPSGWQAEVIMSDVGTAPGIIRLPWLDKDARTALIAHARALLMPSLAEGFGLPVIEAMAQGVPVLCSATGALAETAGGAALLVDPTDTEALSIAISRIAANEDLRAMLRKAGHFNAARFAPANFASSLKEAYRHLVASEPHSRYRSRDGGPKETA